MDGCYQRIKTVNIEPLIAVLDQFEWHDTKSITATVTKEGSKLPAELMWFLRGLELGGKSYRTFLRKLAPNQSIAPHTDTHDWLETKKIRRFQIPLVTHPDILMGWPDDGVTYHLAPGYLYEVNYSKKHEVINNTDCERIHIQIDQAYDCEDDVNGYGWGGTPTMAKAIESGALVDPEWLAEQIK